MWYNSLWLQRKDDYCAGCQNISHCQQQFYSGLHSPRWSCFIYVNIVRCIDAFNQCDHNPLGKLVLYQTCQVRWSCLGTPSFDKGYCRPLIDPVAKFLSRRTTIINFGKTNEIYKLPEKFFSFLDTSHCIPHPMLIQVAANLPMDVANHRQLIIFVSCHPQTIIK